MKDEKTLTWMKVHSGINDAKHRGAMGKRIWLFLYLVDNADWDTGVVWGYTDARAAYDMSLNGGEKDDDNEMNQRTVAQWRRELQDAEYITCHAGDQCQNIVIHKWRNPRKVAPSQQNLDGGLPKDVPPSYRKDVTPPFRKDVTPTLDHSSHKVQNGNGFVSDDKLGRIFQLYADAFGNKLTPLTSDLVTDLADDVTVDVLYDKASVAAETGKSWAWVVAAARGKAEDAAKEEALTGGTGYYVEPTWDEGDND